MSHPFMQVTRLRGVIPATANRHYAAPAAIERTREMRETYEHAPKTYPLRNAPPHECRFITHRAHYSPDTHGAVVVVRRCRICLARAAVEIDRDEARARGYHIRPASLRN